MIRFPFVGQEIFEKLDPKSFAKCREVSKIWRIFLDNGSTLWRKRIQKYAKTQVEFSKNWKLVTEKVPIDILKKLAIAVEQFFTQSPKMVEFQFSPLHIVADRGIVSLCKYVIERTREVNPVLSDGTTPLHAAAYMGQLEVV